MAQFDKLMEESLRLESLPNPSFRDQSRIRSIDVVFKGIEKQLEEIQARRAESPSIPQPQESVVQVVTPSAVTPPPKSSAAVPEVKPVTPPGGQPLTIEKLMSGIIAGAPEPPLRVIGSHDQSKAHPVVPTIDVPKPKERSPVRQKRPKSPPKAIPPAVPAIEDRPTPKREPEESRREKRENSA